MESQGTKLASLTMTTAAKSKEDLQGDYQRLAQRAGDIQYNEMKMKAELDLIYEEMFKLDKQFREMTQAPLEDAPTVEETKTP